MTADSGRYAIYFAPGPGTALARFGAEWLGYDVAAGTAATQAAAPGVDLDRLRAITAEPRHYGFHATLKPPFALAPGTDAEGLVEAIAALAAHVAPFATPSLRLARIAGFLALTLAEPCPAMQALADRCVREFDRFRAPLADTELQRRRRAGLSPRQEALLQRWGYPYVMDEFRFHMTLTARLAAEESAIVERALAPLVAPLCAAPLAVDAVSLFHQPAHDAPFRLLQRYRLSG